MQKGKWNGTWDGCKCPNDPTIVAVGQLMRCPVGLGVVLDKLNCHAGMLVLIHRKPGEISTSASLHR